VRVVLTRNEDANVPHDTRTAIANQNQADLFISLHLNSSLGSGAHGAETYFLSAEASDAAAARMAEAENTADPALPEGRGLEAQDLELILWDLAQTHHLLESQRFAAMIQGELNQTLQLRDRGVKQAPFRVLNGAGMPAVLVELGFISNPDEEKKLQDAAYRAELVASLTRAIGRYKALVENKPEPPPPPGQPGQPAQPAQPGATQPSQPGAQPRSPGRR
jgi:N-acetylmuramoyl-L-alanine amidase